MKNQIIDQNIRQNKVLKGKRINKRPFLEANSVLKMGIVATALSFVIAGLVVGVFALLKANKAQDMVNDDWNRYGKDQWKIKFGKALAWVGVGIGGFFLLMFVITIAIDLSRPIEEREVFNEESQIESYEDYEWYEEY